MGRFLSFIKLLEFGEIHKILIRYFQQFLSEIKFEGSLKGNIIKFLRINDDFRQIYKRRN